MQRCNILLIMTDQHRFDCLGCTGNPVIETPNLDWIASQGTVFRHAYTPSPSIVSPKYRERMERAGYDWTLYRQAKAGKIVSPNDRQPQ